MLYRCYNCLDPKRGMPGQDFWADKPVCPECGVDQSAPEGKNLVITLEIIHFDPPHERLKNRGKGYIACNPKRRVGESQRLYATGDHESVTCEKCIASEAYQGTQPEGERVLTQDVTVSVSKEGVVSHDPVFDEFQEAGCCG